MRRTAGQALMLIGFSVTLWGVLHIVPLVMKPGLWQSPPLYQGAAQVQIQDYGEGQWLQTGEGGIYAVERITYTTLDPLPQVRAFYAQRLAANGSFGAPNELYVLPDEITGTWHVPLGDPLFLHIVTRAASGGTEVEVIKALDPF
jgi:hypothetical protein